MRHDGGDSRTYDDGPDRTTSVPSPIDVEGFADVLDQHPVRLAVLFGSHVKGTQHVDSDIDIAVEFKGDVEASEALLPLLADLSSVADGTDVDVGILSDFDPRIGVAMCEDGVLLVGNQNRFERHCRRFHEQLRNEAPEPARSRFHDIVESAKQAVGPNA